MNAEPQATPRPSRATVLVMPSRGPQPEADGRKGLPPGGQEHTEPADEPGYGHGV